MGPTIAFPRAETEETLMTSRDYAQMLDSIDPLRNLRSEFCIPQTSSMTKSVKGSGSEDEPITYFAGNVVGLQPRAVAGFIQHYLEQWGTQALFAGLVQPPDSALLPWAQIELEVARQMGKIVGAKLEETFPMAGLEASLRLLIESFYRPVGGKTKIIVEKEALSSNFLAAGSQLAWYDLNVEENMVLIDSNPLIRTKQIFKAIDAHAESTAMILLSGIQCDTGQLLNIPKITAYARSHNILICWDLADAAGNVELSLHDWDVDLAVWSTCSYMNSGPGSIGGMFVHEKHGKINPNHGQAEWRPRSASWSAKRRDAGSIVDANSQADPHMSRLQGSNGSTLELTAVLGSLSVFRKTDMGALREKSVLLTGYLEYLLKAKFNLEDPLRELQDPLHALLTIQTPKEPGARGAQLSLKIHHEILDKVIEVLEENHIIVDVKRPSIMRIAPVPLYNTFDEVWRFAQVLEEALQLAGATLGQSED